MKRKVKALWLEKEKEIICESFYIMLDDYIFIGYKNKNDNGKYIVISCGTIKGYYVRPFGMNIDIESHGNHSGTYYVFDTEKELYDWILEK